MVLLRGGEGIGAAGAAEGSSVGAVEPIEAGDVVDISGGKYEGVVATAANIEPLDRS